MELINRGENQIFTQADNDKTRRNCFRMKERRFRLDDRRKYSE